MKTLTNLHPSLRHGWLPLCRITEVMTTPSSFRLMGQQWVAWRDRHDEIHVFDDRCPHRLAPLSLGTCEGDTLRCAYHGWVFDESGACVEIPALGNDSSIPPRARLIRPWGVALSHGMVFIAIEEPFTEPPSIEAANDPSFQVGDLSVISTRASAGLLADNFLDMAHFPFVHAGTFGADEVREVPRYEVAREGFAFSASYEHDFANREDPGVKTGERPLVQRRRLTYRYQAPLHLELAIEFLDAGGTNVIGFFLSPEDDETVRIYSSLWRDDLGDSSEMMQDAIDFERAVIDEDLVIQSQYGDLSLPLDITAEVHTRADRITVELRRILSDFVEESQRL